MPCCAGPGARPGTRWWSGASRSTRRRAGCCSPGAEVQLGARALALLAALARNAGQVVSKARLLDLVWGSEAVDENLVEVHISSLRRRLGPGAAGVIRTVRGVGYMLHDDTVDSDPRRT